MTVQPPVGAVMVVGGGVAGMQAALDLADSGIRVHMIEESTAVGGRMAQLDKTFPTNDCSMCVMSPKLVQLGRHPGVEILTGACIESVAGEMGRFRVRVAQRARYVRADKCTACGECSKVCPVERPDEYNEGLTTRRAVYKRYPQAIPGAYAVEKRGRSPCRLACPAGVSVQGYAALIRRRRFAEALALIRRDNPFPSVCGRVCTHPCEAKCARGGVDEPVAIRDLKKFLTEAERRGEIPRPEPKPVDCGAEAVAVVGAGPAGLTAAYYLRRMGRRTVVFEALPTPGGMLLAGIPEFRLPRDVLSAEIDAIRAEGVEIRCGVRIGHDVPLSALRRDFRAVVLAAGAHRSRKMEVPGEDLPGIVPALDFLRAANLGGNVEVGPSVAVVGGGNSAFDSARVALRLGASEVTILYRRGREEMPADDEEIREAAEEGVDIRFLVAPVEAIASGGRVAGLRCRRMELGEPDASGRRRPVPIAGSEHEIPADTVLVAIGQEADFGFLDPQFAGLRTRDGRLRADPETLATEIPGVFAAGDLVTGASTVIAAIAGGKEAAISVDRFLRGENLSTGRGARPAAAEPLAE
ncbi:MAG: FAD-dependent oxidoreductase, partial [Myxococcota bacterium]|nr:FAD-dependent oxidoreductase [Myxococcota bacterium]